MRNGGKTILKFLGRCSGKPKKRILTPVSSQESLPLTPPRSPFTHDEPLYVILPYFNYCNFKSRKKLFMEFIERYKSQKGIAIVIVEAALQGMPFDLPNPICNDDSIFSHFRITTQHPLWLKENLINIGVSKLPADWKMIAWIDPDITFMNEFWVSETKSSLRKSPAAVIQMFRTAANLGPKGEIYKLDVGYAWSVANGKALGNNTKYTSLHPGFAWACSRHAYDAMGGLIDWAILGSADRHMALAITGNALGSAPGNIHPNYLSRLLKFQQNCTSSNLRLGSITGSILHHWHGSLKDRKYSERWNVLVKQGYNPDQDVNHSQGCGLIQFTDSGRRMTPPLLDYFLGRNEDNRNENQAERPREKLRVSLSI